MPNGTFSPTDEIGVLPDDPAEGQQAPQADTKKGEKAATLQETSKLELIRYVSGEFAKATRDLPAGKEGYLHHVDKPLSPELLERAVATHGAAGRRRERGGRCKHGTRAPARGPGVGCRRL